MQTDPQQTGRTDDPTTVVTTAAPHTDDPVPGVVSPTSDSIRVEARGAALAILVVIAFVFALQWAQKFFIPLAFGIVIAYTLNPVVAWLES
ncbi:hypothetical protein ACFQAT_03660 [Undibacterium arcticum]|uniref:hypothetical protein n=1 Tax=Undibacterium arcticum TaxID=1762892 RepID=UPI00360A8DAD